MALVRLMSKYDETPRPPPRPTVLARNQSSYHQRCWPSSAEAWNVWNTLVEPRMRDTMTEMADDGPRRIDKWEMSV
jgi:hypothetical protein